ncbi:nucleoporin NUP42 isoform X3 [Hydra vulgaris]|uniref:Nucleoporin NUP42 n=1 Tax=Hydra vulgaris TaxID=6087 RepID=A0ABM4BTV1_HYDVU
MVICNFILKGYCKFGNRCRNEHSQQGGAFGARPLFSSLQNDRYHYNKTTNVPVNEVKLIGNGEVSVQMIRKELQDWAMNKVWPFSCFAVQRERNCLSGFVEISPEELRLEAYECKDTGLQRYLEGVQNLTNHVLKRRNQLIKYDDKQLFTEISTVQSAASTTDHFDNKSLFNNPYESSSQTSGKLFASSSSSSNFFNLNNTSKEVFGMQAPNNSTNIFGMQASNNNTNIFGMEGSNNNTNSFFSKLTQSSSSGGLFNTKEPEKNSTVVKNNLFSVSSPSENPFKSDTSLNFFSKNLQPSEKGIVPNDTNSNFFNNNSTMAGSLNIFSVLNSQSKPSSTDESGGVSSLNSTSMGLFSNSGNRPDQKPDFSQVSTQPLNPFFSSQTFTQPTNPFLSSQVSTQVRPIQSLPIYEQLRVYKPIQIENIFQIPLMTSDDIESFKACRFEIGKIPKCPPPIEFC